MVVEVLKYYIEQIEKDTSFRKAFLFPNVLKWTYDDYVAFLKYVTEEHQIWSDDAQYIIDCYADKYNINYLDDIIESSYTHFQEYYEMLSSYYADTPMQSILSKDFPILVISNNKYEIELSKDFEERSFDVWHRYSYYPYHTSFDKAFYYLSDAIQEVYILAVCFDKFNTRYVNVEDRRKVIIELLKEKKIDF